MASLDDLHTHNSPSFQLPDLRNEDQTTSSSDDKTSELTGATRSLERGPLRRGQALQPPRPENGPAAARGARRVLASWSLNIQCMACSPLWERTSDVNI